MSSNGHFCQHGLEDKANVSVLIGAASLGFPDIISWLGAPHPTDNGHYGSARSGPDLPSGLQNYQSEIKKSQ